MPGLHWIHVSTGVASILISSPHFKATRVPRTHAEAQRRHCHTGLYLFLGKSGGVGCFFLPYSLILLPVSQSDNAGNKIRHLVQNPGHLSPELSADDRAPAVQPISGPLFSQRCTQLRSREQNTHAEAIRSRQRGDTSGTCTKSMITQVLFPEDT